MTTPFCSPIDNMTPGPTLASAYTAGSGSMTLAATFGAAIAAKISALGLPIISSSAPLRFTVIKASAVDANGLITDMSGVTIFTATGLNTSTNVLSGVVHDSSTADQNFASADLVRVFLTARDIAEIHAAIHALEIAGPYLTANQPVTLTGDVGGGPAATNITTSIGSGKVTATMLAGSIPASKLVVSDLSLDGSQIASGTLPAARLPDFTNTVHGAVPASGGGTTNFLRADATWAAPPGGGGGGVSSVGLTIGVSAPWLTQSGSTSPITSSGSFTISATGGQTANQVLASPNGSSGALAVRSLVAADIPPIGTITTSITGIVKAASGVLSAAAAGTDYLSPSGSGAALTALNATQLTSGTVPTGRLPVFVASGGSHAIGAVPDPGASAGTTHFLREDATWAVPAGGGGSMAIGGSIGSGTAGRLLYEGSGPVLADSANVLCDGSTITSDQLILNFVNGDYTNTGGANSHILLNNSGSQTTFSIVFSGSLQGKWRTDSAGNLNWHGGASHVFYIGMSADATTNGAIAITSDRRVGVGPFDQHSGFSSQLTVLTNSSSIPAIDIEGTTSQSAPLVRFSQVSSTTTSRVVGIVDCGFSLATDASRTGYIKFIAVDYNGNREGLRIDSNGSAALIGAFGATPVVKPTVTGSKGGNAALASLLTALANLGWITDSST